MLDLNNKMTTSTTNSMVNMLYLQWAYIITLVSFLFMSKETGDGCDGRCIVYPMMVTFLLAIFLYRSSLGKRVKTMIGFVKSKKRITKASVLSSSENSETSSSESAQSSTSSLLKSEQTKAAKMILFLKDPSSSSEDTASIGSVKSRKKKVKDITKSSVEDSGTLSSKISPSSSSSLSKSEKTKARKNQSTTSEDSSVKSGKKTKKVDKSSTENSDDSTSSPVKSEKTKTKMVLFRSDQSASSEDLPVKSGKKKTKKVTKSSVEDSGASSTENFETSTSLPVGSEKTKMANRVLFIKDQSASSKESESDESTFKSLPNSEAASGSETEMLDIPTAYMLWFNEIGRDMVMVENPDLEIENVSKEAGKIWRKMDKEEKDKWEKKLIQLQKKYDEEKKKLSK